MAPDDEIPEHDPLAESARRALQRMADTSAVDVEPWAAVQGRGRRRKQLRAATSIAAVLVVLGAGTAVVANATGPSDHVSVAGPNDTTTSAPSDTSTSSSAPPTVPPTSPPIVAPTAPVGPGSAPNVTPTTTPDDAVQPQDGSWGVAITTDATIVNVGDEFVVRATLTNTGTRRQHTDGYGSWAIACSWADQSTTDPGPESLPIGGFPEGAILAPGESRTFSQTFTADASFVGRLRCGAGIVSHGDAQFADTSNGVVIEVAASSTLTTTTVPPNTTVPPPTTTSAP